MKTLKKVFKDFNLYDYRDIKVRDINDFYIKNNSHIIDITSKIKQNKSCFNLFYRYKRNNINSLYSTRKSNLEFLISMSSTLISRIFNNQYIFNSHQEFRCECLLLLSEIMSKVTNMFSQLPYDRLYYYIPRNYLSMNNFENITKFHIQSLLTFYNNIQHRPTTHLRSALIFGSWMHLILINNIINKEV